ncbi:MAG: hypothetical protein H7067_18375, partial [Burkholderiales bacterium]|nr:hypothetical protein [Opitutaceae bacterium]
MLPRPSPGFLTVGMILAQASLLGSEGTEPPGDTTSTAPGDTSTLAALSLEELMEL